jgi:thymidine phosphorylase
VLDVKVGNGAFAQDLAFARALATSLSRVAQAAGLASVAWITDMNQVLGRTCGNAVETLEAVQFLQGRNVDARLAEVTEGLAAELLVLGKLAGSIDEARRRVRESLASGAALERFARMVATLGGPADFAERAEAYLPAAPVRREFKAAVAGYVTAIATRELGLAAIALGGGRRQEGDPVDPRVGFTAIAGVGDRVAAGDTLAIVHAANESDADVAAARLARIIEVADAPPAAQPVLIARVSAQGPA